MCGTHHDVIDKEAKIYTVELLSEMKQSHEKKGRIEVQPEDTLFANILLNDYRQVNITNNSGNVIVNSPGAIQGTTVNINNVKKNLKVMPPEGTIASDLRMRGYAKHLIDRYLEFAGDDSTRKGDFFHGAIYKNIQKNFGLKWDFIPINRFDALVDYLQKRINKTRQACINKGKGYKSFSSFVEFCVKHNLN